VFSVPYIQQICEAITEVPKTVFAKGAYFARATFNSIPCEIVGLDWNMDIAESRLLLPTKTLQGNLDPCLLYADDNTIKKATKEMLEQFGHSRYIANLGHGVYPDTSLEKVKVFIEAVKEYSSK